MIAILLVIASQIIFLIAAVIESAKYDYILEKDEEFIKLWHQRQREYNEDMKRSKKR